MIRSIHRPLHRLILATVPVLAMASASHAAPKNTVRDTLTIGITQFPATFHPVIESMLAKSYILAMTRRPFVTFDQSWKVICMLCTKLPTIENGLAKLVDLPDGKKGIKITWHIQPKAKWGDGTPVTVKDVRFAWKMGRHPKTGIANREPYVRTIAIDRIDDKTFTQTLDRVRFDYNLLVPDPMPVHLEAKPFTNPKEYRRRTLYDRDPSNPGLYYGPYRIQKIVSGSHVVLVQNPTWYGRKPWFKRIIVRVISNTAALEANLRAGGIDYAAGELGLTADQAAGLKSRVGNDYTFQFKSGLIYEHIDFNMDNPILKDRRVRRALVYGMDRKLMSTKLFRGRQPVANTMVSPLDPVSTNKVRLYPFEPKKSMALLKSAGWILRDDGYRYNTKGKRLTLTLQTTAGNRVREMVTEILQAYWRKIGVDIRIRNQPARVFFGRTVSRRQFPGMAMYAWISSPENVPRSTLSSKMIPSKKTNWAGQNYPGFRNAEMDKLIETIQVELDPEKRKPLWARIQQIYADELPVMPLYFRTNPFVIPRWLKGIRPTGHLVSSTMWVEEWYAVDYQAKAK